VSGNPADPGVRGTIDPSRDDILFREPILSTARINATRPFNQALSDAGGQPIRVVVMADGTKTIMQGNHRAYGAQLDGVDSVEVLLYTPEQWEAFVGFPFLPGGTNNPAIQP
jgi:hypothetical protein